jgi:3-oxoacyl-[acyl-carrier-protein] synthase-1
MSNKKRVVITGMGIVSSIGNNVEEVKNSLINQKSGIVSAPIYKEMGFRSQIHGEVKLNLEDHIDKKTTSIYGCRSCLFRSRNGTSNRRCWSVS